jgi:phosphodiesterase/alkaline phosphatase D-like protein
VAPPIVRDVELVLFRGGVDAPAASAVLRCRTGRAPGDPVGGQCSVVAEYAPVTTPPTAPLVTPATPVGHEHEVVLTGLTPGAYHFFRLRATPPAGPAEETLTAEHRFTNTPGPSPATPPGPAVTDPGTTGLSATATALTWTTSPAAPPGAVHYEVKWQWVLNKPRKEAELPGPDTVAHNVTLSGLTPDTIYYWRVVQPGPPGGPVGGTTISPMQQFVTPSA